MPTLLLSLALVAAVLVWGTAGTDVGRVDTNITAVAEAGGGPPGSTPRREQCGEGMSQLKFCLNQLPEILRGGGVGIPASKKDLDASCRAFKMGMSCMDEYSRACLTPQDRRLMEEQVSGANFTFTFLCNDKVFQEEYLSYTRCYRGMSRDWDSCANRFMGLVREEMARKNVTEQSRLLELCCAKYGFLRCVYVASRNICRREEALFLNRIAETLSGVRVYSHVCKDLDMRTVCAAPNTPAAPRRLLVSAALLAAAASGHQLRLWRR